MKKDNENNKRTKTKQNSSKKEAQKTEMDHLLTDVPETASLQL